ncbi:MAG: hypothetical protein RL134_815 [Actinomycetota bacterium]|jgi:hypothetical protein
MTMPPRTTTTTITTLLTLAPDLVERDRVRRQALRVGAVRHDGLAPLREAAFAGEGLALTWEVPIDAEPLTVGEQALAALAPVAAGLALLHDAGLAHGGVSRGCVHVHSAGAVLSGWRPGGSPEGDVADLVALLDACLPSASVGAEVAQILITGADPDAAARPSMARVAAVLERASRMSLLVSSPPAHRRARRDDAPAALRPEVPLAPTSASADAPRASVTPARRGRHAAHAAPTRRMNFSGVRVPWRWGVAIAGAAAAAFLGFSALGTAGSAQEVCPAPMTAEATTPSTAR